MASVTVLPLATYAAGTRVVGPVSIPDAIAGVSFAVHRCTSADPTIWPDPATSIDLSWEASVDGGETFRLLGGFSASGGIVNGRGGVELALSQGSVQFPSGTNRLVRITGTISGGSIKTQIDLTTN